MTEEVPERLSNLGVDGGEDRSLSVTTVSGNERVAPTFLISFKRPQMATETNEVNLATRGDYQAKRSLTAPIITIDLGTVDGRSWMYESLF
jgi:hypothetical protein